MLLPQGCCPCLFIRLEICTRESSACPRPWGLRHLEPLARVVNQAGSRFSARASACLAPFFVFDRFLYCVRRIVCVGRWKQRHAQLTRVKQCLSFARWFVLCVCVCVCICLCVHCPLPGHQRLQCQQSLGPQRSRLAQGPVTITSPRFSNQRMWMCMWICMCVYECAFGSVISCFSSCACNALFSPAHTYTYTYTYIHTRRHACTHTHTHADTHAHIHTHMHEHKCTHMNEQTCFSCRPLAGKRSEPAFTIASRHSVGSMHSSVSVSPSPSQYTISPDKERSVQALRLSCAPFAFCARAHITPHILKHSLLHRFAPSLTHVRGPALCHSAEGEGLRWSS